MRIVSSCFDKKSKFFAILTSDMNINIFNTKILEQHICLCDDHHDDDVQAQDNFGNTRSNSIIGSFFNKISKVNSYLFIFRLFSLMKLNHLLILL